MKVLKMIKKVILSIVLVVYFAFTITMTVFLLSFNKFGVTQFDDKSLLIIKKGFTSETYKKNSLAIVESKEIKDYKEGDEVFVYHLDGHGGVDIQLGVVGQIHVDDNAITFQNGDTFSSEFIIGTGIKVYDNIGLYLSVIESKWGFLFIILIPNFFLFVYQLYSLIVEIKYGEDEQKGIEEDS
jgi:hypothetical protein